MCRYTVTARQAAQWFEGSVRITDDMNTSVSGLFGT